MSRHAELWAVLFTYWAGIVHDAKRAGFRAHLQPRLPQRPVLLTLPEGQAKLIKALEYGVLSAGLTLSPHKESGANFCKRATSCPPVCLREAGQNRMDPAKRARLWRSALLLGRPRLFRSLLRVEIMAFVKRARGLGVFATMRSNLLSDLPQLAEELAVWCKGQGFNDTLSHYDYTKYLEWGWRSVSHVQGQPWRVYSYSSAPGEGASWGECSRLLTAGGSVAVVVSTKKGQPLPAMWRGFPSIDGDMHDLRSPSEAGRVVLLRFKGGAKLAALPAAKRLMVV